MAENLDMPNFEAPDDRDPYLLPRVKDIMFGTSMPDPKPVNVDINRNIAGTYATGPTPGLKNMDKGMGDSILNYMRQADSWAYDKNRFAKTYDYGADWKHANFDRYYGSSAFKELKFSPYRDNEEHYNNNTSAWDDFLRATSGQFKLFGHGFISMEEGADSAAEAMERINTVYGSKRGGFGGFMSNLALSAGYTQGLVSRIVLEELALAAATVGSGFTASEVTIPAMGVEAVRAGKALKSVFTGLSNTLKTFKNLDNLDVARKVWQAARNLPRETARFFAPETVGFATNLLKGANAAQDFKDLKNYAKVFKGVGSMYSDYRQFRLGYSEGAMEGKMLETKLNEDMINEYYAKNNTMPEGKDAEDIYKRSTHAGAMNTMWNSALIYLSNKIVFGKLFKGIPTARQAFGRFVNAPVGELKRMPYKIGQNVYQFASKDFASKLGKAVFSSSYSPLSRKYMLENFTEGFQEYTQDAFAEGFENYYKDIKTNPTQANFIDMLQSLSHAAGGSFNEKGFETFLSGYLMSTLVQPGMSFVTQTLPEQGRRFIPKGMREKFGITSYDEMIKQREESKNRVLESINKVVADPYKMNTSGADYMAETVNHAKKIREAEESGDINRVKDARSEMYFDHLYRVMETGHIDEVKDVFKSLEKLNDDELAEAMNRPAKEAADIRQQLKEARDNADKFQKIYETQNNLFPDFYDDSRFKKGSPEQRAAERGAYAFRQAKKYAMFANYAFLDATERMAQEMDSFSNNKPLSKTNPTDLMMVFDPVKMDKQAEVLRNEAAILSRGTKQDKAQAKKRLALADKFDRFSASASFYLETQASEKTKSRKKVKGTPVVEEEDFVVTPGATIVNSKGQEFYVTDTIGKKLVLKDKAGKTYTRSNRKGIRVLKQGKEASAMFDLTDRTGYSMYEMYNSYKGLLKEFAEANDEQLFDKDIDDSFARVRDFYNLKNDSRAMGQVVNNLHDPQNMFNLAIRMEQSLDAINKKQKEYLEEAAKTDEEIKDQNALLNDLFDSALKLTPDGIKAIVRGDIPTEFLDEATGRYVSAEKGKEKYERGKKIVQFHLNVKEAKKKADEARAKEKKPAENVDPGIKKHTIQENADNTFTVYTPEGNVAGKFDKREDAEKIAKELDDILLGPKPPQKAKPGAPVVEPPPVDEEKKKKLKKVAKKIEEGTNYDDIEDVEFRMELIKSAQRINQSQGFKFFDESDTAEQISATDWFNNTFMKSAHVKNMIDKYNKEQGLKVEEEPPIVSKPKGPTYTPGQTPKEVTARLELVSKFGMLQAVVDRMTTPEILEEYDKRTKATTPTTTPTTPVSDKKAELQKELDDLLKDQEERFKKVTIGTPIGGIEGVKVGSKFISGFNADVANTVLDPNFDPNTAENDGDGYSVVSKIYAYGEMKDGKLSKRSSIEITTFGTKAEADAFIEKRKIKDGENKSKLGSNKRIDAIREQLAALEGKEEKPKEVDFIADYLNTKRELPTIDLKPEIIYATPSTGKTSFSEKYANLMDADFIIYKYLVENGVLPPAKTQEEFSKNLQLAGKIFYNLYQSRRQSKGEAAGNELLSEVIVQLQNLVKKGYTVLTGNWFMTRQADRAFLLDRSNPNARKRVAEEYLKRNRGTLEEAYESADQTLKGEATDFKGRRFQTIQPEETIQELLDSTTPDVTDEYIKSERINKLNFKQLSDLEAMLESMPETWTDNYDLEKIYSAIEDRKLVLSMSIDYDDIGYTDLLLDMDGNIVQVVQKLGRTFIRLEKVNDPNKEQYTITPETLPTKIKSRYIPGMKPEEKTIEKPENETEFKNSTINNARSVDKGDDENSINGAKGTDKKINLGDINPNEDEDNCNVPPPK